MEDQGPEHHTEVAQKEREKEEPPKKKARRVPPWVQAPVDSRPEEDISSVPKPVKGPPVSSSARALNEAQGESSELISRKSSGIQGVGILAPQEDLLKQNSPPAPKVIELPPQPYQVLAPTISEKSPEVQRVLNLLRKPAPQRTVVFDCESSGFSAERDCVLELGGLELLAGTGEPSGLCYHCYIRPEPGATIHPKAIEVHGLTLDKLQSWPRIADVLPHFLDFALPPRKASNPDTVLVGHNVRFDMGMVRSQAKILLATKQQDDDRSCLDELRQQVKLLEQWPEANTVCTMALFRSLYPKQPANLHAVCQFFGIPFDTDQAHSALYDAKATSQVYKHLSAILADVID